MSLYRKGSLDSSAAQHYPGLILTAVPLNQPWDHKMVTAVLIPTRPSPKTEGGFPLLSLSVEKIFLRCPLQVSLQSPLPRIGSHSRAWSVSLHGEQGCARTDLPGHWPPRVGEHLNERRGQDKMAVGLITTTRLSQVGLNTFTTYYTNFHGPRG